MGGEAQVTVFADTNLGTHIAFNAPPDITAASLKSKSTALKKRKKTFFFLYPSGSLFKYLTHLKILLLGCGISLASCNLFWHASLCLI